MSGTDDFSSARPGDKLWSLRFGPVRVLSAGNEGVTCSGEYTPIRIWGTTGFLSRDERAPDAVPDLYWSRPEIIAPPKPKRMVEKTWTFWVNLYPNGEYAGTHPTESIADRMAGPSRIDPAEKITTTRMVPED